MNICTSPLDWCVKSLVDKTFSLPDDLIVMRIVSKVKYPMIYLLPPLSLALWLTADYFFCDGILPDSVRVLDDRCHVAESPVISPCPHLTICFFSQR